MIEFGKLEKVYQIIVGELVNIDKNQCVKTLYFDSACNKCLPACHAGAISLENGIEVDISKCDGCGFCEQACPNSVFELNKPSASELLSQIKIIRKTTDTLIFQCKPNLGRKLEQTEVAINCFGRINEGILVAAASFGLKQIYLEANHCLECKEYRPEIMEHTVKLAQSVVRNIGLDCKINLFIDDQPDKILNEETVAINSGKSDASMVLSRKDFFGHLKDKMIGNAGRVITESILDFEDDIGRPQKKLPLKRGLILKVLNQLNNLGEGVENKDYFYTLKINKNCSGCDFCSNYCPTGAIKKNVNSDSIKIDFTPHTCTGCNLCVEVCPEKCIKMFPNHEKICLGKREELIGLVLQRCTDCGLEFASKQNSAKCIYCKKIAGIFEF